MRNHLVAALAASLTVKAALQTTACDRVVGRLWTGLVNQLFYLLGQVGKLRAQRFGKERYL